MQPILKHPYWDSQLPRPRWPWHSYNDSLYIRTRTCGTQPPHPVQQARLNLECTVGKCVDYLGNQVKLSAAENDHLGMVGV